MGKTFRHIKQAKIKRKVIKEKLITKKEKHAKWLIESKEGGCRICDPYIGKDIKLRKLKRLHLKENLKEINEDIV